MLWYEVVVLALVQGLTEFLPVSSSGHLIVARLFLGTTDAASTAFDAFLHLGTLGAVLVYYRRVWSGMVRGLVIGDAEGKDKRELAAKLALATVPAAVIGYLFQSGIDWLRSPRQVALQLLMTAAILWVTDRLRRPAKTIDRASFSDAFLIGLAQVVALLPGVSRSAMTIAAGRARELSRKQAVTFSFLMSAPIIAGAGLASLAMLSAGGAVVATPLILGFVVSFVSGLAAIAFLMRLAERMTLAPFVYYLIGLAVVLFIYG